MPYQYSKYKANEPLAISIVTTAGKMKLEELQKHVGGDIEIIAIDDDELMVVNENGIAEELPLNTQASFLAKRHIFGDALVCNMDSID